MKQTDNAHDWLNEHGDFLYRFALARLRDQTQAEDAVQETFLAAIKANNFSGQSSPRTWLTGILKHKIIDIMRKQSKEQATESIETDADMDEFFDKSGHWDDKPSAWDMPHDALEQKQFLAALEACIKKLPARSAAIFTMRDIEEIDNNKICKDLDISTTNAWVMLYRARMSMRKCLEINWLNA